MNFPIIRVLLVEDEVGDAYLVKAALKQSQEIHFEVTWVKSLALAKQAFEESNFDAMLLDLSLPDSVGLETIKRAKQITDNLPIIILTGHSNTSFSLTALKAGANDYMVKGDFGFDGLSRVIRYALLRVEMEQQNKLLVSALNATANGVFVTDKNANIKWVNPAFSHLTGFELNDVMNRKPYELVTSDKQDKAFYEKMWAKLLEGKDWHGELINKHKDGHNYYEELSISPVKNGRGEIVNFIGIKQDISERKILEDVLQKQVQYERAQRNEQSQFMAMLAHELKTPLSVIHLALSSQLEITDILTHANRSVQDISNIINRCLLSEKLNDNKANIDLNTGELQETLKRLCVDTGSSHRLKIDATFSPELTTDWQLLSVILLNLIDNALKYSPPESLVKIDVTSENAGICVSIQNFIGIAGFPNDTEVFQKYYRNKAAHHETGSGLGLYLVKTMVMLLGGEVNYYHDKTTVCFKLWLPFCVSSQST